VSAQRERTPSPARRPAPDDTTSADLASRKQRLEDRIDSLLDEIDGLLEGNAEEFLKGYVQPGGQ
jgi:ubiquitin-like protein Pup